MDDAAGKLKNGLTVGYPTGGGGRACGKSVLDVAWLSSSSSSSALTPGSCLTSPV